MIFAELRGLVERQTAAYLNDQGKSFPLPPSDVSIPPNKIPGDVSANLMMMIAKEVGQSPRQLSEALIKRISSPLIEKIDVAGPGFLNFWLTEEAFRLELKELLRPAAHSKPLDDKPSLLIEFVSANPTGPLHVGHGCGAALGDSLVRIFRTLGHRVHAEFYINDSGGQVRNLGLSVEARLHELKGEPSNFPEGGYKGSYVVEIAKEVSDSKRSLKFVRPDQMVFDESDLAGYASAKILKQIQKTLEDFGVCFDAWYPESALHKKGVVLKLIQELKKKNLAYDQEGATWFKATEFGDEKDRVLQKANEAPTYFASDIAYHVEKFSRGFGRFVNIWGADHHGYAQRLKGALKAFGEDDSRLQIIFNQLVSVKGGRLSKRAGDMVTLQEVVDEVGRDATRFFFALRSPGAHFEFDLDLAKKQASDNPVYYVQYVHARCCSIFKEAEKRGLAADVTAWEKSALKEPLTQAEKDVLLHMASFDRTVEICARDYSNHHMTVYLLELAGKFHSFYEKCHVLVEDALKRSFRLGVVEGIRRRVAQGLDLLGVSAPQSL